MSLSLDLTFAMVFNTYHVIIILCALVILSYLFNLFATWSKIPSVILLIATGVGLRYTAEYLDFSPGDINPLIKILGTVALIIIVLEGTLDLKITRKKIPLVRNSFLSALLILIVSSLSITLILYYRLGEPFHNCLVYSIPLSVISSAIVLPGISGIIKRQREFITYEATFSDILGILFFNYFILQDVYSASSIISFIVNIAVVVVLSVLSSFVLLFLINSVTSHIKFFLVIAILILLYAAGQLWGLPALLLVMFFGLIFNNAEEIVKGRFEKWYNRRQWGFIVHQLKVITAESSFLIRTFFFVLFGYSIDLSQLANKEVLSIGSLIVLVLLVVRFCYLKFILRTPDLWGKLFLLPRGLITIVLFYKIPELYQIHYFNEGILLFVILSTGILMMAGLMFSKKTPKVVKGEIL